MDNFDTRKWFKKQYLEEAGDDPVLTKGEGIELTKSEMDRLHNGEVVHKGKSAISFAKNLKEGIWKVGTEEQIQHFINDIEKVKTHYYSIVGSDAVFNGLDEAIREAEELLKITKD